MGQAANLQLMGQPNSFMLAPAQRAHAGTPLPSPARVVLLALHMRATEVVEALIAQGVPMAHQFGALLAPDVL